MYKVKITKLDGEGAQPISITEFRYDPKDIRHSEEDFIAECSIQAKYRAKIKGETKVEYWENEEFLKGIEIKNN
jgi:hypothetical protein